MGFFITPEQKAHLKSTYKVVQNQTVNLNLLASVMNTYFDSCTFTGVATGKTIQNCMFDTCIYNGEFRDCILIRNIMIGQEVVQHLLVDNCFMPRSNFPTQYRTMCRPVEVDLPSFEDWCKAPNGRPLPGLEF